MGTELHPDYQKEKDRLDYTKEIIDQILGATEQNKDQYKGNIKDAFVELDWVDSSLSYINILTNTKFLEMNERDYRHLKRIEKKPYFARIDFQLADEPKSDTFYIGKTSLFRKDTNEPIIVDWRSPVANVYYDGRLGKVSYEAEGKTYEGELNLKRQLIINEGKLEEIRDVDITTRDELLQESLAQSSSNRLTDIVTTIQEEQNRIIRANLDEPLIVQGVAGSGKTTIALHRISFFIYTYAKDFSPEEMLILAPSKLFLNYISDVLPELGVDRVNQKTFIDFAFTAIGRRHRIISPDEKLHLFIEKKQSKHLPCFNEKEIKKVTRIKGSMAFKRLINRYLQELEETMVTDDDFTLEKFRLYRGGKIKNLFIQEYNYLPYAKRIKKLNRVLKSQLKDKKERALTNIEETYDDKIESVMYNLKDQEQRRKKITVLLNKKEKRMENVKKLAKTAVNKQLNKYEIKKNAWEYYVDFLSDPDRLKKYNKGEIAEKDLEILSAYSKQIFNQNKVEYEDLAGMVYLQHHIFGLELESPIKNVVIDEAQDYSIFQLYTLRHVLKTRLFTILGDLTQGIHSYRGIQDWNELMEHVFPDGNYLTLKKSYRTTIEIMELANEIIARNLVLDVPSGEPVVRHGALPSFESYTSHENLAAKLHKRIQSLQDEGMKTIALIGKTKEDCSRISSILKKKRQLDLDVLKEDQEMESDIVIVPSYLSKGLEFDAVLLVNIDATYKKEELDVKLLYVCMTRALHRLYLYSKTSEDFLLIQESKTYVNK